MNIPIAIEPDHKVEAIDINGLSGYDVYTWPASTPASSVRAWTDRNIESYGSCSHEHDCCGCRIFRRPTIALVGQVRVATQSWNTNV